MPSRQLFNAKTQQLEDAELSVDQNNEIVATFADESFIKFPAGMTRDEFEQAIEAHQSFNEGQEVITPEDEERRANERANSEALIADPTKKDSAKDSGNSKSDNKGNTMPEGDKTNAPKSDSNQ